MKVQGPPLNWNAKYQSSGSVKGPGSMSSVMATSPVVVTTRDAGCSPLMARRSGGAGSSATSVELRGTLS